MATSTGPDGARDGIEAAQRMTDALEDFSGELKDLSHRDRRSRMYLRILATSFILDIALTVVVTLLSIGTSSNNHAIHESQISACQATNGQRASERAIWTYVLNSFLVPSQGETQQQIEKTKQFVTAIEAKVNATFPTRDCVQLYKLP